MWIFSVMRLRQKRMQGAPNPMAYGAERGWRTKLLEDEGASTLPSDPTSEAEKAKQTNGHVIGVTKEKESNNTPSSSGSVLQVSLSDYRLAAASLADTFKDDEVARYYLQLPDCDKSLGAKAQRLHLSIYECLTAAHCCAGLVTAAGPNFDAVALWLPPTTPWTWKTYWKSKMWILYWQFGSEGRKRFFGSWDTLAEGMTKIMGERADSTWTLTDLGTRSESRGRGYASRLIRHGLKLTDRLSQPVYVECSSYNVSFYERFGFQVKGKVVLNGAEKPITLESMVREPT